MDLNFSRKRAMKRMIRFWLLTRIALPAIHLEKNHGNGAMEPEEAEDNRIAGNNLLLLATIEWIIRKRIGTAEETLLFRVVWSEMMRSQERHAAEALHFEMELVAQSVVELDVFSIGLLQIPLTT
jgi:hypothetical protein